MKDKNGIEIKVGDIVKNTSNDIGMVIQVDPLRVRVSEWIIDGNFNFWGKVEDVVTVIESMKEVEMRFKFKENSVKI